MSLNTCPIATVEASAERVWQLLADPAVYALWWDAQTLWVWSIEPGGPAQRGQRIHARTRALGTQWDVHITIVSINEEKRQLSLTTELPLGITVHNHITCTRLDDVRCRVTFG
jgi:polyketide cyclase/dehydrase/lipid transport protein